MSKLAAFLGANTGPVLGASVFVVGALGTGAYMGLLSPQNTPSSAPQEVAFPVEDAPKSEVAVANPVIEVKPQEIEVKPQEEATPVPEVEVALPRAPSIDEVRSEADGLTILAGRGQAGSDITLFVDDIKNTTVQIGNDGAFAIVAFLDPSPNAKVLRLIQLSGDIELATADIILAPQAVAEAEFEPQDEPVVADLETQDPLVDPVAPEPVAPETAAAEEEIVASAPTPTPTANAEVAILKSDEDGVQVINRSSAPEVMSNVEIDTISYSDQGDVLLSGRAQSEASSVRVYLDNAPVTTLEVDTSGRWRGDLPDVDTGIYTLRVDEVDAEGAVTSRVETPFKREDPEVLEAAAGADTTAVKAITVQTGATLWAIARDRYGDGTLYVRVVEANADSIKDADLIYPGQVFDLPD